MIDRFARRAVPYRRDSLPQTVSGRDLLDEIGQGGEQGHWRDVERWICDVEVEAGRQQLAALIRVQVAALAVALVCLVLVAAARVL